MLVPITKQMIRFAYEAVAMTGDRCPNCVIAVAVNAVLKPGFVASMVAQLLIHERNPERFVRLGKLVHTVSRTPEMQDVITVFDSGNLDKETVLDIPIPQEYVVNV